MYAHRNTSSAIAMLAINENLTINELRVRLAALDNNNLNYETVDLSRNDLQTLHIIFPAWFRCVRILNLNSCHLSKLKAKSIDTLTALESFRLDDNVLHTFPIAFFRNCSNSLRVLLLNRNCFRSYKKITLEPLRHLTELDFSFNRIRVLKNLKSESIEVLKLNANQIEEIKRLNLPQLKFLDLSDNLLERLTAVMLTKSPRLVEVRFSNNRIQKMSYSVFDSQPHLKTIDLARNQLSEFELIFLHPDARLEQLNLAENRLNVLQLNRFGALKVLNVTGNGCLKDICGWKTVTESLETLKFCRLVHDRSRLPDLELVRALRKLDLSGTTIDTFPDYYFDPLERLRSLRLNESRAANLAVLSDRLLFTVDEHPLRKLKLSDCDVQAIESRCFRNLSCLTHLDLSRNLIGELVRNVLSPLVGLQSLQLQKNCLRSLDEKVFWDLIELRFIDLTANSLEELSLFAFMPNMKLIEQRLDPWIRFVGDMQVD